MKKIIIVSILFFYFIHFTLKIDSEKYTSELPSSVQNKNLGIVSKVSNCKHSINTFFCDIKTDLGNSLTLDLLLFKNNVINKGDLLKIQILNYSDFKRIRYLKNKTYTWRTTCKMDNFYCQNTYEEFYGIIETVNLESFDHELVINYNLFI